MQVWVREQVESSRKASYKQLAIEEKESYKWIRAAEETKQNLPLAEMLTLIGDREADCYEEFVRVPDERTHLLVRSCQNRRLADGGSLYERLSGQAVVGEYEIEVKATTAFKDGLAGFAAIVVGQVLEIHAQFDASTGRESGHPSRSLRTRIGDSRLASRFGRP